MSGRAVTVAARFNVGVLTLFTAIVWTNTIVWAAPPAVSALFPAGARPGTTVAIQPVGVAKVEGLAVWSDRPELQWQPSADQQAFQLTVPVDAPTGVAWVRLYNAEGASTLRPLLISPEVDLLESEPNNRLPEALAVPSLPHVCHGILQKAGDVDCYRVTLTQGQTFVATLDAHTRLGSPLDGLLQIVGPHGFVVAQNDDSARGNDPLVEFRATQDGDYVVRVFAFPAAPDSSIRYSGGNDYVYRLLMTSGPLLRTTNPAVVAAGRTASLHPLGWNLPDNPPPFEAMFGPAAGWKPVFWSGGPSVATVLVTETPVVARPLGLADPFTLPIPSSSDGVISQKGAVERWSFTAEAGQDVTIRAAARSLGSPLDVVIKVTDAAGSVLTEVDDQERLGWDIEFPFKVPAVGTFGLTVSDRFGTGSEWHRYAVQIEPTRPDVVVTTSAEQLTINPGEPGKWPVAVERRSGFAEPLRIEAVGLPEGVTAEAVVSAADGATSKAVELVITSARTAGWSGPVQLVGRSESGLTRTVLHTLSNRSHETSHLWLTVVAPPAAAPAAAATTP
jgi:hypothetical protein